jgi:hypothetical protein
MKKKSGQRGTGALSSRREEGRFGVSRSLKRKGNVERPLFKAKSSELLAYLDWDWFK